MKRLQISLWVVCFLLMPFLLLAQEQVQELETITITGQSYEKYTTGSRVTRLDSGSHYSGPAQNLAELLAGSTPAYIRNQGHLMLSTLSLRGTGPGHTALIWNGININITSLGLSDFSLIPAMLPDEMVIHHGPGSALHGTDAIGGSILLNSKAPVDGLSVDVSQTAGSFSTFRTQAGINYKKGRWGFKTKAFLFSSENNFPYENIFQAGSPRVRQANAAVNQSGLQQEVFFHPDDQTEISGGLWYTQSDREIQPGMLSAQHRWQKDEATRAYLKGRHYRNRSLTEWTLGYNQDQINFFGEISVMPRITGRVQHDVDLAPGLMVQAGVEWNTFMARIAQYEAGRMAENRQDYFLASTWQPWKSGKVSFNIRQSFVAERPNPLAPTFGFEQVLTVKDDLSCKGKLSLSRSYRVPTLNDRFWLPGGNQDLDPEESLGGEIGQVLRYRNWELEVTHFRQRVDNWIIWLPQPEGYWAAGNIREVSARGWEISLNGTWELAPLYFKAGGQYSYTRSEILKGESGLQPFGQQLAYVPFHNAAFHLDVIYGKASLRTQINYTGERFTSLSNDEILNDFLITDLSLNYRFNAWSQKMRAGLGMFNLWDVAYQNIARFAMPGRSYQVTLALALNQTLTEK